MTLEQQLRLAKHILRLTKTSEIVFLVGRTNKGNLGLKFTNLNDEYELMLDAVPLSTKDSLTDENNIELKKMIEKYWFLSSPVSLLNQYQGTLHVSPEKQEVDDSIVHVNVEKVLKSDFKGNIGEDVTDKVLGKKRGRPKGSKSKK